MIKRSRTRQETRTHFEQVPLDVVNKLIGVQAVKKDGAGPKNLIVETAASKTEPYSLAARAIVKADIKPKAAGRPR